MLVEVMSCISMAVTYCSSNINPGEPKTCFIFRKKLNCVYNGYYRLTKHKKVKKKKKFKEIFHPHVNLYSD